MTERRKSTEDKAHDVLAADEFAVPAPAALRHRGPVVLPDDPTGDPKPHDVLAAEAFAGPSPSSSLARGTSGRGPQPRDLIAGAILLALVLLRARRRRARS